MSHTVVPYRISLRHDAGFTLAELLVVVAIVLVLVAIAVPVFTGSLERTEEATCAANRHHVKVMVSDAYLLDNSITVDTTLVQTYAKKLEDQNSGHALCPSGGNYSFEGDPAKGSIIIKCSKHGLSMDESMYQWVLDTFKDNMNGYTGGGTLREEYEKYAKDNGLDSWPEVTGIDGKTYYLQMKNYENKASATFLYAGYESKFTGGSQWDARYVCDNTGLIGNRGQWYEIPKTNLGTQGEAKMIEILKTGTAVNLVNGEFVAA